MVSEFERSVVSNHTGRMVLTPNDPQTCPDRGILIETLSLAGLIGAPLRDRDHAFLVGPGFFSLMAFTGCAVVISSDPGQGTSFCHVRIPPASRSPRLSSGRNTRPPRCPGCRGRLTDWASRAELWELNPTAGVACPSCGQACPLWLWDWKQQGGFGRRLIEVEEVFPGEAVPTQALLDLLKRASGSGWRFFYIQD